jgi:hypothetical protein
MEYQVMRYKANQWGIFAKTCRCFVLFGLKKDLVKRCEQLNKGK